MNIDMIRQAIEIDLHDANATTDTMFIEPYIGISCVDQVKTTHTMEVLRLPYSVALTGHGPQRNHYSVRRELKGKKPVELRKYTPEHA